MKASEFNSRSDYGTQVIKDQQTIVSKKPNLAQPHRRLIAHCQMYEVDDVNKQESIREKCSSLMISL
ncbi:IQ motif and SEC7 domain-containing protein 1-like isoform X2 [Tachypleus tridentatus]|uniref:IQ motif and SEC7 domain-containing protein 1-like isoform X1 n=1 Tax=Tachypleus tridentatus TaxID=6853 RepID=UPI003FD3CFF5